ncbi:hypothetical protein IIA15_08560 [candidate division TA06 bacterium]|nr:hypothetical protein [candidate division TA06 bacterium]
MKANIFLMLLGLGGLLIWGCYGSDEPTQPAGEPGPKEVWIVDNSFNPQTLTVAPGDTVTWFHKGGNTHTVTSGTSCNPSGFFNSPSLTNGNQFQHVFPNAVTIPYFCIPHCGLGMTGSITVQ